MHDQVPTPVPLPLTLPEPFEIPPLDYKPPEYHNPEWAPIPIYREDVEQRLNTKTSGKSTKEDSSKDSEERVKKDKSKESTADEKPAVSKKPETSLQIEDPPIPNNQLPTLPNTNEFKEVTNVTLPIIGIEIPVPKPEILVTAVSTAGITSVASVGGTLAATALFPRLVQLLKPLITFGLKKVAKIRGKPEPLTWARRRVGQRLRRSGKTGYLP